MAIATSRSIVHSPHASSSADFSPIHSGLRGEFSGSATSQMWFVATAAPAALRRVSVTRPVAGVMESGMATVTVLSASPFAHSTVSLDVVPSGYAISSVFVDATATAAAAVLTIGTSTDVVQEAPTTASRWSPSLSPTPKVPPVYFGTAGAGVYL